MKTVGNVSAPDYNTHKKPLSNGEELFSDFDSDHCCCWGSQSSGAATDPQSVGWRIAKITSQDLLQSKFLNSSLPSTQLRNSAMQLQLSLYLFAEGNFLFATPPNKVSPLATANFISCEIKCTNDPVLVTLKFVSVLSLCSQLRRTRPFLDIGYHLE